MSSLILFACAFAAVFGLGLQSLNVNGGHHLAASLTSLFISVSTIWLYKAMPGSDWLEIGAYMAGAIAGINASMWVHPRAKAWAARRLAARVAADEHRDIAHCGRMCGGEAPSRPPTFP